MRVFPLRRKAIIPLVRLIATTRPIINHSKGRVVFSAEEVAVLSTGIGKGVSKGADADEATGSGLDDPTDATSDGDSSVN